jgi:uncharacterized membrane protein
MPYRWRTAPQEAPGDPGAFSLPAHGRPLAELDLWPYRSLSNRGFVAFAGVTAFVLAVPLLALIGTAAVWIILPFAVAAFAGMWLAIRRTDRSARMSETLALWPDRIEVRRREADGGERAWRDNPYWVSVRLYESDGPVPNYLTLKGASREVELGAFLSEDERVTLKGELERLLPLRVQGGTA